MFVSYSAKLQTGKLANIHLKHFGHIVIELITKGTGMHTEYGFITFVGTFCELSFNIVKIRDRFRIIIFHCVGIEAYKFHTSCNDPFVVQHGKGKTARSACTLYQFEAAHCHCT